MQRERRSIINFLVFELKGNVFDMPPVFTAALFIIARTWKQPRCPSAEEWTKKRYIYTMEYYSATKRNEIGSFVKMWMELETLKQSEIGQKEKKSNINTYMWNLKKLVEMILFTKQK